VSCGFSREMLALHVEGDLPDAAAAATISHVSSCAGCRQLLEDLRASQALVKSTRGDRVSPSDCTAMRREVMAIINERPHVLGWWVRIERALTLGLRPSYGMAALALLGILSASVLAQIRPGSQAASSPVAFEGADTLLRPEGYRQWVLIAGTAEPTSGDRVYIDPPSHREYTKTGQFPDGTVLVWEQADPGRPAGNGPHPASSTLLVSFKASGKFDGSWAFFDFSETSGGAPKKARALPESSGCRTCHRRA
jgi:hypothetical protein